MQWRGLENDKIFFSLRSVQTRQRSDSIRSYNGNSNTHTPTQRTRMYYVVQQTQSILSLLATNDERLPIPRNPLCPCLCTHFPMYFFSLSLRFEMDSPKLLPCLDTQHESYYCQNSGLFFLFFTLFHWENGIFLFFSSKLQGRKCHSITVQCVCMCVPTTLNIS